MDFSFGIVSDFSNIIFLKKIIKSIKDLNINNYEIIIIGNNSSCIELDDVKIINYKDNNKLGDISVKKNMITDIAKYENIVYLHDYILFDKDWYSGYVQFGSDFDICINIIENIDGSRFRDWCLWKDDGDKYVAENNYLLPYDIKHLTRMMYISGAYWVAKKTFMIENRINERLSWGQGEDVEWSIRSRSKTDFKLNENSKVILLKYKNRIFNCVNDDECDLLKNIREYDDSDSYDLLIENHLKKWM